jgi:hypothetical protein
MAVTMKMAILADVSDMFIASIISAMTNRPDDGGSKHL